MQKRRSFRRFGLLGYPLGHSLSPFIHEGIMQIVGISGEYKLYPLESELLSEDLPKLLATLDGFNCTIPHKVDVIPYLDRLAPSALLYGAVNTVHQRIGYNTDGVGFASCQVPIKGRSVCVLGAGGVARVLTIQAARAGAQEILIVARSPERADLLVREVQDQGYRSISSLRPHDATPIDCDVCLNGTPVGMWPDIQSLSLNDGQIRVKEAVFDTIYNPTATRLVLQAKTRGIWAKGGLQMLFEQALAAQKIWNPEVSFERFIEELRQLRKILAKEVLARSPLKLVLTGFMGSGKSTVGQALAKALSLPFVDLDEVIVKANGLSIPEIFRQGGEAAFRSLERQACLEQLQRPEALVLATGGGTLVQDGLVEALRRSKALIIYLDIPLERALKRIEQTDSRPMLGGELTEIEALYAMRRPIYAKIADLQVSAEGERAEIVKTIMTTFEWQG